MPFASVRYAKSARFSQSDTLKVPYYENSTFLVLLHVHLGIWRVYQPKNAGKKPLAIFVMVPGSLLWSETS